MANSVSRHHHQLTADSAGYVNGIKAAEAATRALQDTQNKAAAASDLGGKSASRFGQVTQQAGYQMQDFAVQVAGGQNGLVALAQQGSQMLGVFGATGAIAGAVLSVGVLAYRLYDGAKAAEEQTKRVEELTKAYSAINKLKVEFRFENLSPEQQLRDLQKRLTEIPGERANLRAATSDASIMGDEKTVTKNLVAQAALEREIEEINQKVFKIKTDIYDQSQKDLDQKRKDNGEFVKAMEAKSKAYDDESRKEEEATRQWALGLSKRADALREQLDPMVRLKREAMEIKELMDADFITRAQGSRALGQLIKSPETPSALRTSSGASSLGGSAASGDAVLNIQNSILAVQKEMLSTQKRQLLFLTGSN